MLETVRPGDYDKAIMDICKTTEQLGPINFVHEILSRSEQYRLGRVREAVAKERHENYEEMRKESERDPVPPEQVRKFLDNFHRKLEEK